MLNELFPKAHVRFSSLPLLGAIAEGFADWLQQQGYKHRCCRILVRTLARIDAMIRQRGRSTLSEVTREDLLACRPANSQDDRNLAGTIHALECYLDEHALLSAPQPSEPSRSDNLLADYQHFLEKVRGFSHSTVAGHLRTVSCFLEQLNYESAPAHLSELNSSDVEMFISDLGTRHSRGTLQHEVAHLRGFFRFGTASNLLPSGLDTQVDAPRLYRLEQLPRTLPWESVCSLLASIDCTTTMGLRDYAMLFLIATYGFRACDIRTLQLDDIHWRQEEIRVTQHKTRQPLVLPLTEAAGDALVQYLRHGRPQVSFRQVFLRLRAPLGPLGLTGVNDAFAGCVKRSGLQLPVTGIHCLRHAYALHLLRQGTSLKTIGDLLGHRTAESTCVYLRLAIEDLRGVALDLPKGCAVTQAEERS